MTQQFTDPFILEGRKFVFLGADDVYGLFDPEKYGLHPDSFCTACYKGFIVSFSMKAKQLYVDKLIVYCRDHNYPVINGDSPVSAEKNYPGCYAYENLNIKSGYSGVILIGDDMLPEYWGRAFTGPHSYAKTYELTFENGLLTDCKDTSGSYSRF